MNTWSSQNKGQDIFGHYPTIHPLQLGDTHFIVLFFNLEHRPHAVQENGTLVSILGNHRTT